MVRVGFLVSQFPSPSHTFIRREAQALRERGVDVQFFSIRGGDVGKDPTEIERAAQQETFYVLRQGVWQFARQHVRALLARPRAYGSTLLAAFRHRVPGVRPVVWSLAYFAEAIVLAAQIERRGIDVLHNHFGNAAAITGMLTARFLGIPWGFTVHGASETDYPACQMLPAKIMAADYAACVSYYGMSQAMRGVPPNAWKKLFINHCGIDLTTLPQAGRPADGRTRIICVGRLASEKGHFGLLQAFKDVAREDIDLVLVGDGPLRRQVEDHIAHLGLERRVKILGALSEQATLCEIARSDILVLSSLMEGLPVVLMEAMALRLPVIAPRIAGIPELVEAGVNGLMFTPANWGEMGERLAELLAMDTDARQALGEAGRAKIEREFEIGTAVAPIFARLQSFEKAPSGQGIGAVKRTRTSTGCPATTSR